MDPLRFIAGYPPEVTEQAVRLLEAGELGRAIAQRYPERHEVRSSRALHDYVHELKARYLKKAPPLRRVLYDDSLQVVEGALGLHVTRRQVQGSKLRTRRELRVAGLFQDAPADFLRMICVHELAHLKHDDHDRDFYRLCTYMEPDYHRLELDLRLYLVQLEWPGAASGSPGSEV